MSPPRVLLSWSSGKDSAWALQRLREAGEVEVAGLLTTLNAANARVAMHAVRESLLDAQAEALGLPLWKLPLPWPCANADYEAIMAGAMARMRAQDIAAVAYGDLFLEDIRAYREARHQGTGVDALFPLWGSPTGELAREMIRGGLRARITCLDPNKLPPAFAGRAYDASLLADLPAGVDPCAENGEFHTFVWDGPMFRRPLCVHPGAVVARDGFVFADLLAEGGGPRE